MKRILATACGGPSTLSFTRSLRDADPEGKKYYIVGTDCDRYNIHRAEVDAAYLCPMATDPGYISFIKHLIKKERIDFLHSQPEIEAFIIGKNRDEILSTARCIVSPKWREKGACVQGIEQRRADPAKEGKSNSP